ncbi:MAG: DUF488 domain-containing protein [Nitrospiraceae bacterium]|nr:DUF488 domain-containing protein [Nitrospiraceae bacterium]
MVKTRRIYDPPSRADGKRILVDRLWPRGVRKDKASIDEWLKEIAPSDGLRKWYSHDPARWEEFRKKYKAELQGKGDLVERLRKESKEGTITLLFAAKDPERNNAEVLRDLLMQ